MKTWIQNGHVLDPLTGTDQVCDVLVDGEFMKDKKNISLQFRGSENQRLIDLRKTEEAGEIVWWKNE